MAVVCTCRGTGWLINRAGKLEPASRFAELESALEAKKRRDFDVYNVKPGEVCPCPCSPGEP